MAGKTNTKQICVYKTKKALLEFMDDTRYEKEGMAWPHTPTSRIRINAKDYSDGTGGLATDAFYNLSPDEFFRLQAVITKAKTATVSDYTRCSKHLERLMKIKGASGGASAPCELGEIRSIAEQFAGSSNEIFSEAGQKLMDALKKLPTVSAGADASVLERMIAEANAELEEVKKARELYSDVKILNYDRYINPENEAERRITSLKVVYHPKMNYPYAFTVSNGWAVPLITKQKGVMIKEGSARYVDTVNILIDEKSLFPMLKRIETFLQAMATHGLAKYFETVTNPVLYYQMDETDE